VGEEIITLEELRTLLEKKKNPIAYDGFEPSGQMHIAQGLMRTINVNKMVKAGCRFRMLVADWHAWANNKFGGDLERIQTAGKYMIEVWKACGMRTDKIDFVWAKDVVTKLDHWKTTVDIARNSTVARITRCSQIMGRKTGESLNAAQIFYPCMQAADIFRLGCEITQLGMDQRKVNMLAREIAERKGMINQLGYEGKGVNGKPVVVSHRMLMGLMGPVKAKGFDDNESIDKSISSKMSKSLPDTAIFVHDSEDEIKRKINAAFCPMGEANENPILEYAKEIVFRSSGELEIKRPEKFGGDVTFYSYSEVEKSYVNGDIHPQDLKIAVAEHIDRLISPIRRHFEKDNKAGKLYGMILQMVK